MANGGWVACCLLVIVLVVASGFIGDDEDSTLESLNNTTDTVNYTDKLDTTAFEPENYTFIYNDGNSTEYKGDTGLIRVIVKNKADNLTYSLYEDLVRGIDHDTKGTFEFDDNITAVLGSKGNSSNDFDYRITKLKYSNGSEVKLLSISDDSLTADQKAYFDDYESQREEYNQKQLEYQLEDVSDSNSRSSNSKQRGLIFGPNGIGYYQSF